MAVRGGGLASIWSRCQPLMAGQAHLKRMRFVALPVFVTRLDTGPADVAVLVVPAVLHDLEGFYVVLLPCVRGGDVVSVLAVPSPRLDGTERRITGERLADKLPP